MQYKILESGKYGHQGKHIDVCKGDVCELPEFIAQCWLSSGKCELPTVKKKSPVVENKAANPVVENKSVFKKKIKKASK